MKRYEVIASIVPARRKITGVELGVYKGKTSNYLLQTLPKLTLYMVDRWRAYTDAERAAIKESEYEVPDGTKGTIRRANQKRHKKMYDKAKQVASQYPERAIIVKSDTVEAINIVRGKVDFVFVDAGHDYASVCRDIDAWLPKIKAGGFLFGHDYDKRHVGLRNAVDERFKDRVELFDDAVWMVRC